MLNWSNVSTKRNEVRWRVDLCSAADCCSDAQLRATQLQDVARLEYRHRESNMDQNRMILSTPKILNSCNHDSSVAAMSHPLVRNVWTEGQQSAKPWPGGPRLRDQCDYSRGVVRRIQYRQGTYTGTAQGRQRWQDIIDMFVIIRWRPVLVK